MVTFTLQYVLLGSGACIRETLLHIVLKALVENLSPPGDCFADVEYFLQKKFQEPRQLGGFDWLPLERERVEPEYVSVVS